MYLVKKKGPLRPFPTVGYKVVNPGLASSG